MGEVQLRNIRKEYNNTVAVDDVSLTINDGELVALLGPSGCGKTTTLRMISGLEYPTSGQLLIGDNDVTGVDPRHRNIAMVFQDLALYPHKSVRGNMGFALSQRGYDSNEIERRVEDAAEILEIPEMLDRRPQELSGGQQQRVALGRAIVRDPEVFLLDEPLSSLDAKLREQMRTEILEIHRNLSGTMVYVTHDQEIAMTLGDRIAVMNNGNLMQIASPNEVYRYPANEFVARFIGSPDMNLFEATVQAGADVTIDMGDFDVTLEESDNEHWRELDGETVNLGIRPQDIYIPEFIPRSHRDGEVICAEVDIIEERGSSNDVRFICGDTDFTGRLDTSAQVEIGDTVNLVLDTTMLHFFDPKTGERIGITDAERVVA